MQAEPDDGIEEVEVEGSVNRDPGSGSAGAPQLDGELMQALSSGELPQQLASMTTALQEQLKSITEEMNRLKGEIYDEQGGIAEKLGRLTEELAHEQSEQRRPPPLSQQQQPWPHRSPPAGMAGDGGQDGGCGSVLHQRRPGARNEGALGGSRRVDFAAGTNTTSRMSRRDRLMETRRQELSWTPYLIGFTLVCIGPLRPLLIELAGFVWQRAVGSPREAEDDVPWYDQ